MSAPVIPDELQIYNSYVEDPKWQRKFTIVWTTVLAAAIVFSVPRIIRGFHSGVIYSDWFGLCEYWGSDPVPTSTRIPPPPSSTKANGTIRRLASILCWTIPYMELDVARLILVLGYLTTVVCCMVIQAPLKTNANRAGFLAIAQLPVVFLFGTKNSALTLLLLGPGVGYEKLNIVHRWAGRGIALCALVHGAFWINNHLKYDQPIIGQQKEEAGIAALSVLVILVLTSLRPVRRLCYQAFFYLHILTFPAFFITICVHTPYAHAYLYPPLAFYAFDLLLRAFRFRLKDATIVAPDTTTTLIRIHNVSHGWHAGQYVRLRAFIGGRHAFESHPLTIANAPRAWSCITANDADAGSMVLSAGAVGDWSRALNEYARSTAADSAASLPSTVGKVSQDSSLSPPSSTFSSDRPTETPIEVTIDGPYGGCSLDLGMFGSVFLVAGGSGITFTLGLLDDLVGRIARQHRSQGERTRCIEFAWCIRSFGAIKWAAPLIAPIAARAQECEGLQLRMRVYVTCLCDPEAVPDIPGLTLTMARPKALRMLRAFVQGSGLASGDLESSDQAGDEKAFNLSVNAVSTENGASTTTHDGIAVCVAGPQSLALEMSHAVARIGGSNEGARAGGIALHSEVYQL